MKRIPAILALAFVCAATVLAGVPDEAEKPAPPVVEKPSPEIRAKAAAAIKVSILEVFKKVDGQINFFDRGAPIVIEYTSIFVDTAPGEITANAERLPFEIRRTPKRAIGSKEDETKTIHRGYYDAKAQAVKLYDPAAKTYVLAAEHPAIKPRALKGQKDPVTGAYPP